MSVRFTFTILLLVSMFVGSACHDSSTDPPESTTTRYSLVSADNRALPAFSLRTDLSGIDTGWVAIAKDGSVAVTRYAHTPANSSVHVTFGYGYGIKYGPVMESTFKSYDRQQTFQDVAGGLQSADFLLTSSGDSLFLKYWVRHDDRMDLDLSHEFRLAFVKQ